MTAAAVAVVWGLYAVDPAAWPGLPGALLQTAVLAANVHLTACRPRAKVAVVRALQGRVVNPLVRGLLRVGLNPLGLVLLETRGRRSGRPRVVPVGNGRRGDVLWVVAEHGLRAHYVRNIRHDARVRVRVREGLRHVWREGAATVLPHDDATARQREIAGLHPLRLLNAATVRLLGADLVTVRVDLRPAVVTPGPVRAAARV